MGNDTITIGGIQFQSNQVAGYKRENSGYKVTLSDGSIFTYTDQSRLYKEKEGTPKIFGTNMEKGARGIKTIDISNCNIDTIKGTQGTDTFVLHNSNAIDIDVSGDKGSKDTILYDKFSYIRHARGDDDDHSAKF